MEAAMVSVPNTVNGLLRRQFVGDFFKESRHLPLFEYKKRQCTNQKSDTGGNGDQ